METKKCLLCGEELNNNRKKYCDYCRVLTKKMSIEDIISHVAQIYKHSNLNKLD